MRNYIEKENAKKWREIRNNVLTMAMLYLTN
jgi:hypothetical protein